MFKRQLGLGVAAAQQIEPLLEPPGALARLQPVAHQLPERGQLGQQVGPLHGVGARTARIGRANGSGQARVCHRATAQHQGVATRHRAATLGVFHRPDLAIGHHRNTHRVTHLRNQLPIGGRAVAICLGARMHHQLCRAAVLHGLRAFAHQQGVVKTQAHLGGHGQMGGHGPAHSRHHSSNALRLLQQGGTTPVAVDHLGGAAKVQVNAFRLQGREPRGVFGHAHRV